MYKLITTTTTIICTHLQIFPNLLTGFTHWKSPQKYCSIISTTRSHIRHQSVIMNTPLYLVYICEPALLRYLDRFCFFILLSHNYHTKFSALKLSQIHHIKCCTKISSSVIQALSLSILSVIFSHNYHIINIYPTHWHLQFSNQMTQYVAQNYNSNLLRPDRLSTFILEKVYNTPRTLWKKCGKLYSNSLRKCEKPPWNTLWFCEEIFDRGYSCLGEHLLWVCGFSQNLPPAWYSSDCFIIPERAWSELMVCWWMED